MTVFSQINKKSFNVRTQKFETSGSFTVPEGVNTIFVWMAAAGGGSSRVSGTNYCFGAGGSGGYYKSYPIVVTPGDTLTVVVGAKGTSSSTSSSNVTKGGNSRISNGATVLLEAWGGGPGSSGFGGSISSNTNPPGTNSNYGGGNGGFPGGSGGSSVYQYIVTSTGQAVIWSGGSSCDTSVYSFSAGYPRDAYFGPILGLGEFAGGNGYGGSSPFGAGHGGHINADATGGYDAEDGLVILTWYN